MAVRADVLVRTLHVVGMALLLGGTAFAWNALRRHGRLAVDELLEFEAAFWGLLAVVVFTGVGNLAELGAPVPGSRWGTVLTVKLLVVAGVAALSGLRTAVVYRLSVEGHDEGGGVAVRWLYAGTAWGLVGVVVLAEVLVHG